jgi:hypothetical protein
MSADRRPLAIDLFSGLGGWTHGLLAEGFTVVGFDIERHVYGEAQYPAQLVLQDVLTLDGAQFRDAALIVASPPCQAYSYRAMPWKRAKALPPPDNSLCEACFRIQREAIAAAGHFIPRVVENVCGAQKWVGKARWHYGSFYRWGDVPALMPIVTRRGMKVPGFRFDGSGRSFQSASVKATKNDGGSWFAVAHNTTSGHGQNPDGRLNGVKRSAAEDGSAAEDDGSERDHPEAFGWKKPRTSSHSSARKAAAAQIAQIPETLARHIAKAWKPEPEDDGIKQSGHWFKDSGTASGSARFGSKSPERKAWTASVATIPEPLARHIAKAWKPE